MTPIIFIVLVACILLGFVFYLLGRYKVKQREARLVSSLYTLSDAANTALQIPTDLPAPVFRYLTQALPQSSKAIRQVVLEQSGQIRTSTSSKNWLEFSAKQVISPLAKGFVWNAKVKLPLATQLQVLDSYCAGVGSGAVSLFSALTVSAAANVPQLNSGALHRYLAEAVWYPTALLPQFGIVWEAIDDRTAVATLSDHGISVALEFRFNEADEVVGIYSPGRFARFGDEYKKVAWEGHFRHYQRHCGFLIPSQGEVGWYDDEKLQLVWKGVLSNVQILTG